MPAVTQFNVQKGYRDYTDLHDLIEGANKNLSVELKNIEFARKIEELMTNLGVPETIRSYGLKEKDIEFLIEQYAALKLAIDQNPVEITKEDAGTIIKRSFKRMDYARV